jgi:hypothetical protein
MEVMDDNSAGNYLLFPSIRAEDCDRDPVVSKFTYGLFSREELACSPASSFIFPLHHRLTIGEALESCYTRLRNFPQLAKDLFYHPSLAQKDSSQLEPAFVMRLSAHLKEGRITPSSKSASINSIANTPSSESWASLQELLVRDGQSPGAARLNELFPRLVNSCILLQFYAVHPPAKEIQQNLVNLILRKLDHSTFQTLSQFFQRNEKVPIVDTDYQYLCPQGVMPSHSLSLSIPQCVSDHLVFLLLFKQNLTAILQPLYRAESGKSAFSSNFNSSVNVTGGTTNLAPATLVNLPEEEAVLLRNDFIFLYNHSVAEVGIGARALKGDRDKTSFKERVFGTIDSGMAFISASIEYQQAADKQTLTLGMGITRNESSETAHAASFAVQRKNVCEVSSDGLHHALNALNEMSHADVGSMPSSGVLNVALWPKHMRDALSSAHPLVTWITSCAKQVWHSFGWPSNSTLQTLADYLLEKYILCHSLTSKSAQALSPTLENERKSPQPFERLPSGLFCGRCIRSLC